MDSYYDTTILALLAVIIVGCVAIIFEEHSLNLECKSRGGERVQVGRELKWCGKTACYVGVYECVIEDRKP